MKSQFTEKFNQILKIILQAGDQGVALYFVFEDQIDSSKNPEKEFGKRLDEWKALIDQKRLKEVAR